MDTDNRSSARLLAPIAIVVFAIALLIVLTTAGGDDKSDKGSGPTRAEQRDLKLEQRGKARSRSRTAARSASVYVVKTGDTLGSIAERTGVPVEKLQELNPTLDPQALVSGQRIKLK
jgi:LysM repeat protein